MGFIAYTLTLTGAAQRLSTALPNGGLDSRGQLDPTYDVPLRMVILHPLKATAADIFVGMDNTVSSANHAFRLDPGDTLPPFTINASDGGGGSKPSDFWVIGTAGEKLGFGGVTY